MLLEYKVFSMFSSIIFKRSRNVLIIRKEIYDDFSRSELFSETWLPNLKRDDVFVHKPKNKQYKQNGNYKITYLEINYIRKQRADINILELTKSKVVPKKKYYSTN